MRETNTLRELYEARRLEEAWGEYERLRQVGPVEAGGHLLGALTARVKGDYGNARRCLERAMEANPSGMVKGQVLLTAGVVLLHIGDSGLAVDHIEEFLSCIDEYPELAPIAVGSAWYNLGLAYRAQRKPEDAVYAYERAALACMRDDQPELLRKVLQNLAWVRCLLGDTVKAEAALCESHELCKTSEAVWHQRIGMAFLESLTGERSSALRRCEAILKATDDAPSSVVSQAHWICGRIALDLGELEPAATAADQAIDWALKVKDETRPMQDANELRRQVYIARVKKEQGA